VTSSPSRAALAISGTIGGLEGKCALVTGGTTGLGLAIEQAVREERGDQADRPVIRLVSGPLLVNNPAAGTSA
jgi:NAD(P)-dependent dehydrogenase (short-subunit alcohol dehydrogenase family)